ncbi:MAG TPA: ATP-grasp domain-containing protein [Phycisphaerae bacterium]|nr:ATP-grasp domain-containing protein [Phycisphaerae bacterium]
MLFTCVGRRVELVRAFRRAAEKLGIALEVHGADGSRLAPALWHVDRPHLVPAITSGKYEEALLGVVRAARINLLVPLLDHELPAISGAAERFAELGCTAVISSPEVVQVCQDKLATYAALRTAGIDTPTTWAWTDISRRRTHRFPYFLKPRTGSASMGNYVVHNRDELMTFGRRVPDAIVQEFVPGIEHTLDVYTGFDGRPRCVVPRRRLEVRTGEVSKGLVVKDRRIMAVGHEVARMLRDGRGVLTVQCILTPQDRIRVIEINPRFGGGAPLSIHAGADFPRWILAESLGRRVRIAPEGFRDDVAMLRFDDSVFVPRASRLLGRGSPRASTPSPTK